MDLPLKSAESRSGGFTIVELLVVTAVLAIIMGIAMASIFDALDKARQAATMADMHSMGVAIGVYNVDHGFSPLAADFDELIVHLAPYHLNDNVPDTDHWANVYDYQSWALGYSLTSFGRDGVDGEDLTLHTMREFERDIVMVNGEFRYAQAGKGNKGKHLGKDHGTGKPDGAGPPP